MTIRSVALVAALIVCSFTPVPALAQSSPAAADGTDVKAYLLTALAKMEAAADRFVADAAAYKALVDARNGEPVRAFNASPNEMRQLIERLREEYKAMDSFGYETIEGIVAGVPSLSDFDIYLDAGVPQDQAGGGTPVAPVVVLLPSGGKIDREGSLFTYLIEPMLWGSNHKLVVPADLDHDGKIGERESLPRVDALSVLAADVSSKIHELRATAVAWQPSTADYFSAIITMTPTLSGYFDDWKESRYSAAGSGKFTAVSRVSDMRGIMSSVAILYSAVREEVARKDPALANSIQRGFDGILAFIERVDRREVGTSMAPAEIDELGEQAKQKADKLVPQVEQAAAVLDVAEKFEALQSQIEEVLLDSLGNRLDPQDWSVLQEAEQQFATELQAPAAKELWAKETQPLGHAQPQDATAVAKLCGRWEAMLEHVLALEMIDCHARGDVPAAQAWRALIALPKHANAVEGALALQRLGADRSQQAGVSELLAREYLSWQTMRVREKLDGLKRAAVAGRASRELVASRFLEVHALSQFPPALCAVAHVATPATANVNTDRLVDLAGKSDSTGFIDSFNESRTSIEAALPNLLSAQEVARHGRLLVKLVRLIPKEYRNGVRDGEIVVPLEYREAKDFIVQAQQLASELSGSWRQSNPVAYEKNAGPLSDKMEQAERLILAKAEPPDVERATKGIEGILSTGFGLSAQRVGPAQGVVEEVALEVRAALKNSLAAAQAGRWAEAESLRVDAYTTFDTEIEKRALPRDPELALRAERSFLDGERDHPGIKALFDQRRKGAPLDAAFARTFTAVEQCTKLVKVNLSPPTVIYTVLTISAREGLEAVVVLAALLAGMRGAEDRETRRRIVTGAWLALGATALTFWLSRTLIQSLSRFGEKLESIVSVLAVLVLLMVTNWVFHKVYWVGWNAKLRKLTKSGRAKESRLEWLSLVGVGFLTIYREGFETTLFLQSLILEAGMKWVLVGIACGGAMVGAAGFVIFVIGARLPYRKLLVFTGVLVVTILVTFLGSTVRLFQTVGWLSIHPIASLHVPAWAGFWLGFYPSVEGVVIPLLGFAYVGIAWLIVKWHAVRRGARQMEAAAQTESFAAHPALAKRPPVA